jgi:hypothetical protein
MSSCKAKKYGGNQIEEAALCSVRRGASIASDGAWHGVSQATATARFQIAGIDDL